MVGNPEVTPKNFSVVAKSPIEIANAGCSESAEDNESNNTHALLEEGDQRRRAAIPITQRSFVESPRLCCYIGPARYPDSPSCLSLPGIPRDQPPSITASSTQRAPAIRGIYAEYSSIAS